MLGLLLRAYNLANIAKDKVVDLFQHRHREPK